MQQRMQLFLWSSIQTVVSTLDVLQMSGHSTSSFKCQKWPVAVSGSYKKFWRSWQNGSVDCWYGESVVFILYCNRSLFSVIILSAELLVVLVLFLALFNMSLFVSSNSSVGLYLLCFVYVLSTFYADKLQYIILSLLMYMWKPINWFIWY